MLQEQSGKSLCAKSKKRRKIAAKTAKIPEKFKVS